MLIKYRTDVVHSARHATCAIKIGKIKSRSIVHIRSSFKFKQRKFKWPPTISINKSKQPMKITVKNNVRTLADYHPVFKNFSWGMLNC